MRRKKINVNFIKSHIPKEYFDGSELNGVSLKENSYDLYESRTEEKTYILRTKPGNPLINILKETFDVQYVKHWWCHYHEYKIKLKNL